MDAYPSISLHILNVGCWKGFWKQYERTHIMEFGKCFIVLRSTRRCRQISLRSTFFTLILVVSALLVWALLEKAKQQIAECFETPFNRSKFCHQ